MSEIKPLMSIEQINKAIQGAESGYLYMIEKRGKLTTNKIPVASKNAHESLKASGKRGLIDCHNEVDRIQKFAYDIKNAFSQDEFNQVVMSIRDELNIPQRGFNLPKTAKQRKASKADPLFIEWIEDHHTDGFKRVIDCIKKYRVLTTDPRPLLSHLYSKRYQFIKDKYYIGNSLLINPIGTKIYLNYTKERPFVAVFDFILFHRLFIPITNFVVIEPETDYINIKLSSNSTSDDVFNLWSIISKIQEKMDGYSKNKSHKNKNFDRSLKKEKLIKEVDNKIKKGRDLAELINKKNKMAIASNPHAIEIKLPTIKEPKYIKSLEISKLSNKIFPKSIQDNTIKQDQNIRQIRHRGRVRSLGSK